MNDDTRPPCCICSQPCSRFAEVTEGVTAPLCSGWLCQLIFDPTGNLGQRFERSLRQARADEMFEAAKEARQAKLAATLLADAQAEKHATGRLRHRFAMGRAKA